MEDTERGILGGRSRIAAERTSATSRRNPGWSLAEPKNPSRYRRRAPTPGQHPIAGSSRSRLAFGLKIAPSIYAIIGLVVGGFPGRFVGLVFIIYIN
jgi:hypothetical protein